MKTMKQSLKSKGTMGPSASVVTPPKARPSILRGIPKPVILPPRVSIDNPPPSTEKIMPPVMVAKTPVTFELDKTGPGTFSVPSSWYNPRKTEALRRAIRGHITRLSCTISLLERDLQTNKKQIEAHREVIRELLHCLS